MFSRILSIPSPHWCSNAKKWMCCIHWEWIRQLQRGKGFQSLYTSVSLLLLNGYPQTCTSSIAGSSPRKESGEATHTADHIQHILSPLIHSLPQTAHPAMCSATAKMDGESQSLFRSFYCCFYNKALSIYLPFQKTFQRIAMAFQQT